MVRVWIFSLAVDLEERLVSANRPPITVKYVTYFTCKPIDYSGSANHDTNACHAANQLLQTLNLTTPTLHDAIPTIPLSPKKTEVRLLQAPSCRTEPSAEVYNVRRCPVRLISECRGSGTQRCGTPGGLLTHD
ncbi:hypothetical protein Bbelb_288210 [Branchiostoma belcheri]|nr:hypothetical protein Bbelb_288210 [Branchiostoma belcheri]